MLKITEIYEDSVTTALKLEGKLVKEWGDLLKQESEGHLSSHKRLKLDLSGVSFIDSHGIQILKTLESKNVELCNCSVFLIQLLKCSGGQTGATW